nr:hypothetical protein [Pseudonocardia sp. TRM90224]
MAYRNLTASQLRDLHPEPHCSSLSVFFVADTAAMASAEHPLLVPAPSRGPEQVDHNEPPRAEFRVVVTSLWSVENNLSISNMDWEEFADSVDDDGVFRGV